MPIGVLSMEASIQEGFYLVSGFRKRVTLEGTCKSLIVLLCGSLLGMILNRIDFHADEAFYLHSVPMNASKDTGLFYHISYLLLSAGPPTPLTGRWTSLLLGMVMVVTATRAVENLLSPSKRWLVLLIPIVIVVSYQGIFSILRVRPEISWFAVASIVCCCITELRKNDSKIVLTAMLFALALLPMNHLLSLFACFLIGVYLLLFGWQFLGKQVVIASFAAMFTGMLVNSMFRNWWIDGSFVLLPTAGVSNVSARTPVLAFIRTVLWESPVSLEDRAVTPSLWQTLLPASYGSNVSHVFAASLLWWAAVPLALFGRTWEQRYVFSVPVLVIVLFYVSGYFNGTYATLMVIYSSLLFAYISLDEKQFRIARVVAVSVLLFSLCNGVSFLATRVLNHGPASFFDVERNLRDIVRLLPKDATIAVPERFMNVVPLDRPKPVITFKDELPENLDVMILDNYDFDMYRFVANYDSKREVIDSHLSFYSLAQVYDQPIYRNEFLMDSAIHNDSIEAVQSSWFFRNSTKYRVFVSVRPDSKSLSDTKLSDRTIR